MSGTSRRGFASMDAEKRRAIASKGGRAAHQKGTAHRFTPEEARAAGKKGGQRAHEKGTAHRFTSEEAREAARKANGANGAGHEEPALVGESVGGGADDDMRQGHVALPEEQRAD